ncbi:protein fem-1 homolog CG6966-like [Toxorhynchites rutilus septentrionalis]|uniref:protein fem-1 homolog CG6966-like n=1 Tax=Toxorhynchites rutilus septentrionalis TaxID=329112 RepID=UPI002478ADDA|nr:protein fem-1 homolog CG6966-like [Toxorhynchites rutilus septentrionalis]
MSEHSEEFLANTATSLFRAIQSPTGPLPKELREKLQSLPRPIRKKVVETKQIGFTALASACIVGNTEIMEYLVKECDANIEQKCIDSQLESYTPLRWVCVSGNYDVLKHLIRLGADAKALSDCGSTLVLLACRQRDHRIVRYLVRKGADVRKTNNNGETCLIAWIKTCMNKFDNRKKGTIKLLLKHGADPFVYFNGDDALKIACRSANYQLAFYLINILDYTPERKADAYELVGATLFFKFGSYSLTIFCWRQAHDRRLVGGNYRQKRPEISPHTIYGNTREFRTLAELEEIMEDPDAIGLQGLLICERVLGTDDKDTLSQMTRHGHHYQLTDRIQKCIDLWMLVLQRQIQKYTILDSDSSSIAQKMVGRARNSIPPRFEYVWSVFQLLASDAIKTQPMIRTRKQQRNYDWTIRYIVYLMDVLLYMTKNDQKREMIKKSIRELVCNNIRCVKTGETLLHLSIEHRIEGPGDVTKLLLECGAHIDLPDLTGVRPSELLAQKSWNDIPVNRFISLKCYCANTIVGKGIPYGGRLPPVMENFVREHEWQRTNHKTVRKHN